MSGRPNPQWILTDPDATDGLLSAVAEAGAAAKPGTGYQGMGFREVQISIIEDDPQRRPKGVPRTFALGSTTSGKALGASGDLARRLVEDMTRFAEVQLVPHQFTPLTPELRDLTLERLERYLERPPRLKLPKPPAGGNPLRTTVHDS